MSSKHEWVKRYKNRNSCWYCGSFKNLEFHHKDPKLKVESVGTMLRGKYTIKEIREEIAKCTLVCKECHDRLHGDGPKPVQLNTEPVLTEVNIEEIKKVVAEMSEEKVTIPPILGGVRLDAEMVARDSERQVSMLIKKIELLEQRIEILERKWETKFSLRKK